MSHCDRIELSEGTARTDSRLVGGAVHVWRAHIPDVISCLDALCETLSADERERADRFFRRQDAQRFVIGRGMLRCLLGRYLALPPRQIAFEYGPHGKPEVAAAARQGVAFNLSHSGAWVVCAFAHEVAVGVDVEYMNAIPTAELASLADTVCCANELQVFHRLSEAHRKQAFFDLWTCKEAYIKAIGTGFSLPPTEIEVSIGVGPPCLMRASVESKPERWSMRTLKIAENYAATLITDGPMSEPVVRTWNGTEDCAP